MIAVRPKRVYGPQGIEFTPVVYPSGFNKGLVPEP